MQVINNCINIYSKKQVMQPDTILQMVVFGIGVYGQQEVVTPGHTCALLYALVGLYCLFYD